MANYKQIYMRYMDDNGIKYSEVQGRENVVKVVYTGDNLNSIPVFVFFDKDGEGMVTLKCWDIANFKGNKLAAGLIACNDMNDKYRWVKFYVDKDGDIIAQIDAYIDERTCGYECASLVRRVVNITDEAYPTFMKALWSK